MTRETKLGLGVGVSFLSLVAVVAYTTLHNKGEELPPAPEAPQPTQVAKALIAETQSKAPASGGAVKQVKLEVSAPPSGVAPLQFPLVEPSPANNSRPPAPAPGGPAMTPTDVVVAPALPLPPPGGVEPPFRQPIVQDITKRPQLGTFPSTDSQQVAAAPKAGVNDFPLPPSGPAPVAPPSGGLTVPPPGAANALAPGQPQPKDTMTFPGAIPPPAAGVTPKAVTVGDLPSNPTKAPAVPKSGTPDNFGGLPPGPNGPAPIDKGVALPPGGAGGIVDFKQPAPGPATPPNASPIGPKVPLNAVPELPTGNAVVSPAIPLPSGLPAAAATGSKVQVNEYKDLLYRCEASDTDFAALSKRFYKSEAYAQALQAYNRDHPSTSNSVRQGGKLQPGAEVYIPDLHALESRSSNPTSNPPATAAGVGSAPKPLDMVPSTPSPAQVPVKEGPASGSPVPLLPPTAGPIERPPAVPVQPLQPVTPPSANNVPPVTPRPIATTENRAGTKLYMVQQGGQHFYNIARETLGDADRWPEIWRLNQQFAPENPVPAGAQLQLPADARVGQ